MTLLRTLRDGRNRDWTMVFLYPYWLLAMCWMAVVCAIGFGIGWKIIGPIICGR